MDKKLYFVAGLPRSGSTLLMNMLGQNPDFYVTPTSGILDVLVNTRNRWQVNEAFRALPWEQSEKVEVQVLRHIMQGYFAHVDKPVCIDKNRSWLEFLELAEIFVEKREDMKVIVTVRDLRDVLASFEKLYRKTAATAQIPQESQNAIKMKTAIGRVQIFIDDMQPVGRCFNAIRDAVTRGWKDHMLFVEYDRLTSQPQQVMDEIYEFLGQPKFKGQNFDHVDQITFEDDSAYGFKDLHKIRPVIEAQAAQWPKVYDSTVFESAPWKAVEKVATFWKTYLK